MLNVPYRCTLTTASKSSGDIENIILSRRMPALFTSTSRRPNASIAVSMMFFGAVGVGDAVVVGDGLAAAALDDLDDLVGDPLVGALTGDRAAEVVDDDLGAVLGEHAAPRPDRRRCPAPVTIATLPSSMPICAFLPPH